MSDMNAQMAEFANNLWDNYIKQKLNNEMQNGITFYRASVTTNNHNGTLEVQKPFDTAHTVKCTEELWNVSAGESVIVVSFGIGNASNKVAICRSGGRFWNYEDIPANTDLNTILSFGRYTAANLPLTNAPTQALGTLYVLDPTGVQTAYPTAGSSYGFLQVYITREGYIYKRIGRIIGTTASFGIWCSLLHDYDLRRAYIHPTMISGIATYVSGGYYTVGNRAFVDLSVKLSSSISANSSVLAASNFPTPYTGCCALSVASNNVLSSRSLTSGGGMQGGIYSTGSSGYLVIGTTQGCATSDVIYINGSYATAD